MTTPTHHDQADAVDGAELLDDVAATISRYVILPSTSALIAVVLWIAATHAVPAWNCAPRLVIRAPEKALREVAAARHGRGHVPPAVDDRQRVTVSGLPVHRHRAVRSADAADR